VEKGGEEIQLGRDREENGEKGERVATGGFSSTSVVWGSEGKRRGASGCCCVAEGEGGEGAPGVVLGNVGHCRRSAGAADRWG
jgi:hypothetical protein